MQALFKRSSIALPTSSVRMTEHWCLPGVSFTRLPLVLAPQNDCRETLASVWWRSSAWEGLAQSLPTDLSSWPLQHLHPLVCKAERWFCAAAEPVFVRCKNYTPQIALGNSEKERELQGALSDTTLDPRRCLLLGTAIRFLSFHTGKDTVVALL